MLDSIATVRGWPRVVDALLAADLPVGVYDLAVDVLHPKPRDQPARRQGPMPWHLDGYQNRTELVAALRAVGYDGPTSRTMADLWTLLEDIRAGSGGPGD